VIVKAGPSKETFSGKRRRWVVIGGKPGAGRPRGARSALAETFVQDVLSVWSEHGIEMLNNLIQQKPGELLRAVATIVARAGVPMSISLPNVRSPEEIRRWVDRKAFVGVRVVPWLWNLPPNDRRYYPIYAACIDAGVPLCTQIGHTGPLRRSEVGRLIPYLEDVMLEFPELVVVGGHVGFPWIDELITMTVKFPNFHVDTSTYVLHRLPPNFVDWMKGVGASRVMFGTNWPMLSPAKCLAGLARLELSGDQKTAFLRGNALRVFGLQPSG
jgi:predicted TIM-barrel fold metal-dependent hydrolase